MMPKPRTWILTSTTAVLLLCSGCPEDDTSTTTDTSAQPSDPDGGSASSGSESGTTSPEDGSIQSALDSGTPSSVDASTSTEVDGSMAAAPITYYDGAVLPGRLMLGNALGEAEVYTLATGDKAAGRYQQPFDQEWAVGASPEVAMSFIPDTRSVSISFYETTKWSKLPRPDLVLTGRIYDPKLSPDGRHILTFRTGPDADQTTLTIIDAETGALVKEGDAIDRSSQIDQWGNSAVWFADGTYVYMGGKNLYLSAIDAQQSTRIAQLPLPDAPLGSLHTELVASPDGEQLAFSWGDHLWVMSRFGTGLRRLTAIAPTDSALSISFQSPTWSPDGKWIAGIMGRQFQGASRCLSPVFVVPSDAEEVPVAWHWPGDDQEHGVAVRSSDGSLHTWYVCADDLFWLP